MKRILDDPSESSRVVTVRRLLQHVPPLGDQSGRQRRLRPRILAAAHAPQTRIWQPAMVLVLLLGSAAAAHAMSGGGFQRLSAHARAWFAAQPARSVAPSKAAEHGATSATNRAEVPSEVVSKAPTISSTFPTKPPPSSPRKLSVGQGEASVPAARSETPAPSALKLAAAPSPSALTNDPGTQLMVEAMQARRAGDTARSERLLGEYRRHFPSGALQEEALALSVEAAILRHRPGAAQLARAYLAQFPHGRYRQWMEQTLAAVAH